ncbi:MAG: carbohydrate kinase family protein [Patescibacteria group bacterium]|nr:carbohydrate kinase family protein [Patescibacteria group bacterium]
MFDIVTIGHSTVDYFLGLGSADIAFGEDDDSLLCIDFADKIPVENFKKGVGGNAANTGVGCARLGLNTAIVSWIGKDLEGELVLKTLKEENIELLWVRISEEEITDQSVILNFEAERTILSYHCPRTLLIPADAPESRLIYLTSAGRAFEEVHPQVLQYAEGAGAKLAYNPGSYELAGGLSVNKGVLEHCAILILNSEEAGELARGKFVSFSKDERAAEIGELMHELREAGPETIVVTDGSFGSYAFDGENIVFCPSIETQVVEMTGAGDAFSAGFLSAWVEDKSLKESLQWGNTNAASVISEVGCQEGLLSREKLLEQLP